ncbi:MAG: MFS transporter [Acidimicrobiales bacterium]
MSTPGRQYRVSDVLRHRDFALLWSGQAVSLVGDGIFVVALALEALHLSHSPALLSVVVAARMVPMLLLLLLGGAISDRLPRRLTMLTSDAVRGLAVGAVAILVHARALHPGELVAMAIVFGSADAFFFPASTAIVPEVVPSSLLTQANALSFSMAVTAQSLIGPALGGLLVGVIGVAGCFTADAASFALSALSLALMRVRGREVVPAGDATTDGAATDGAATDGANATGGDAATVPSGSVLREVKAGLSFTFRRPQRWLWVTILAASVGNAAAFTPQAVLTPLLIERVLHGSGFELGLVFAAGGVGGAVGAVVAGRLGTPRFTVTWMWAAWSLAAALAALYGIAPRVWVVGALATGVSFLLFYGTTQWTTLMQTLVPRHLLGRVSSVDWLFSLALSPIGALLAGVLAGAIGTRTTLLLGGGLATAVGACLFVPGVRDPERAAAGTVAHDVAEAP